MTQVLKGVFVKLSEVRKKIVGDKIYILHCNCLKDNLWKEENAYDQGRCADVDYCEKCKMYPWIMNRR